MSEPAPANTPAGTGADDPATPTLHDLHDRAVRGALWTIISVVVGVPIAFLANAVMARALGASGYGDLALLGIVLSIVSVVSLVGFADSTIQWGAAAYARGDHAEVDSLLRRSTGFHLLVQLPGLAIVSLVLARGHGPWVIGALLFAAIVPCAVSSAALTLTIKSRAAAGAKVVMATNLTTQAAIATTAVLTHSATDVWAARTAAAAAGDPLCMVALTKAERRVATRPAFPRNLPPGFWRYGFFSMLSNLAAMLVYSRSEVLILQGFGLASAAGVFALGFGLTQQITAPVDALLAPLQPAVAGVVEAHVHLAAASLLRITRITSVLCAVTMAFAIPILTTLIPLIYGHQFARASVVFLILGVMSGLQSVIGPLATFAQARRASRRLLVINVAGLIAGVVIAVALVPLVGLWGAVAGNTLGQLTSLVILARSECRVWQVSFMQYLHALLAYCATAVLILSMLLLRLLPVGPVLVTALTTVGALLAAALSIRLGGSSLTTDDLAPVIRALPRPIGSALNALVGLVISSPKPSEEDSQGV